MFFLDTTFTLQNIGQDKRHTKNYKVIIPYLFYEPIKPQVRTYKGSKHILKLQKGWVDVFLESFFKQFGFLCSYTIKYHNVVLESRSHGYVSFNGQCNDPNCRKPFYGSIKDKPEPGKYVVVNFLAVNTTGIKHTKKRFLRQPKRNIISEEVTNSGTSQWRQKMADCLMDYGDVEPPNLYTSSVLRKTKQQYADNTLGISGNHPVQSLTALKYEAEHVGSIHNIGSDPFGCHYWLPIQDHIYKLQRNKSWTTIFVDATGSLVLPIIRTKNISSAYIFLYQMVTEIENQTVPIAQQLSEKQDMLSIYNWMANWVNKDHTPPNECICDYSKALLGAITRSFCNRKSLKDYNSMCFEYLIGNNFSLPECYVRIDIAHIIHMLCRWKCLKTRSPIKDFYVRCICQLIKAQSLNEFKKILEMIFLVALAETDGVNTNSTNTSAEDARIHLLEYISHGNVRDSDKYEENEYYKGINQEDTFFFDEESDSNDLLNDDSAPLSIQEWVNDIQNSAIQKSKIVGDRLNAFYCPDLVKSLAKICVDFPLWSTVMVQHFKSPNSRPSSARVESYFSTLKTSILTNKTTRMRVDKFIITHLRAIRGDVKLAAGKTNVLEKKESNITKQSFEMVKEQNMNDSYNNSEIDINSNSNSSDEEMKSNSSFNSTVSELEIENWNNKADQPSPKKSTKITKPSIYLENQPEIKTKQKMNKNVTKYKVDLARNGSLIRSLFVDSKQNKTKCQIINTCAFDTLIQAISTAYIDSQEYAKYVNSNRCTTLQLGRRLVEQGANKIFYEERLKILKRAE